MHAGRACSRLPLCTSGIFATPCFLAFGACCLEVRGPLRCCTSRGALGRTIHEHVVSFWNSDICLTIAHPGQARSIALLKCRTESPAHHELLLRSQPGPECSLSVPVPPLCSGSVRALDQNQPELRLCECKYMHVMNGNMDRSGD